jgi:hypothetical protein
VKVIGSVGIVERGGEFTIEAFRTFRVSPCCAA